MFLAGSVMFPLNCNIMTLVSSALTFAIFATTVVVIFTCTTCALDAPSSGLCRKYWNKKN